MWEQIAQKIEGLPLVAHNACFDEGCLKAAFQLYQMDYPDYTFYDTLTASREHFGKSLPNHQLHTVSAACGYELENHHHALADAEACAAVKSNFFFSTFKKFSFQPISAACIQHKVGHFCYSL